MDLLKGIVGKVVTGAIVLAVVAALIAWFQMPAAERADIVSEIGRLIGWAALVLAAPWAMILLIARVAKVGSNPAGIAFVGATTIIELALLGWLLHWHVAGGAAWIGVIACGVIAAAYNILACDWIAERFE